MKSILLIVAIGISIITFSQKDSTEYLKKVQTVDAIMGTLYDVISGDKGKERDWDLFRYLFKDGAKLIPSGQAKDGSYKLRYDTPEDYISKSGKWLEENGFHEREIYRELQQFGNIAHVMSTYKCFHTKDDKEPFMRGINSIQLMYDNERWWIVNIYWAQETPDNPIPENFLPPSNE